MPHSVWADSLPDEARAATVKQIGHSLSWSDPERAGNLMLSVAKTPEERSQAYSSAVSSWAFNDPNAAGKWLGEQEQGPELDLARQQFATSITQKDPESAMAWANAVMEEKTRALAVQSVYMQWRGEGSGSSRCRSGQDRPERREDRRTESDGSETCRGGGPVRRHPLPRRACRPRRRRRSRLKSRICPSSRSRLNPSPCSAPNVSQRIAPGRCATKLVWSWGSGRQSCLHKPSRTGHLERFSMSTSGEIIEPGEAQQAAASPWRRRRAVVRDRLRVRCQECVARLQTVHVEARPPPDPDRQLDLYRLPGGDFCLGGERFPAARNRLTRRRMSCCG